MRSVSAAFACVFIFTGCSGGERYEPDLGAPKRVAHEGGPVVLHGTNPALAMPFVDSSRSMAAANFYTKRVLTIAPPGFFEFDDFRDVVSDGKRALHSYVDRDGRLVVAQHSVEGPRVVVWQGDAPGPGEGRLASDRDGLLIAAGGRIVRPDGEVVSAGWRGPVAIAVDGRNRLWAVDAGDDDERPRLAPGRERSRTSRHRHATFLPEGSRPVAAAADETEVYVCDAATNSVLRFHVGLDDVPRKRDPLEGVKCRYDIAVLVDGSIVTATDDAILWYPRR